MFTRNSLTMSHVRVRLSTDCCAKRTSGCKRTVSEGRLDDESCPREVVNGLLRETDKRMQTDCE